MDPAGRAAQLGIGHTPLVPLPGLARRGRVSLKAEFANPFAGVKDRTAVYLVEWARSLHGDAVHVVESTSGNLGIALSRICGLIGAPVTLVMDASSPERRIRDVEDAGGTVRVVREPLPGRDLRESRIALAGELGARPGHQWVNQYENPAGARAHHETTGPEIWADTDGHVQALVASVGTGGTLCGAGGYLKSRSESMVVVGVEPVGSTIFGGAEAPYLTAGAGHRGASGLLREMMDTIDLYAKVPDVAAACWAARVRRHAGVAVGLTAGAAVAVACAVAEQFDLWAVAIAPDAGWGFEEIIDELAGGGEAAGQASATVAVHPLPGRLAPVAGDPVP
jgi:cysteine synthase